MKLAKEIAEEQERGGVAYMDDLCACFDRGVAEKIITARLEPVKDALKGALSASDVFTVSRRINIKEQLALVEGRLRIIHERSEAAIALLSEEE